MQIAAFALGASVSLLASTLLVSRLERLGERLGLSEALLGLLAALAADSPEITSSVAAVMGGQGTVAIGVALGSNVFNLAALLGLGALVAGHLRFHRRTIMLEGAVALWIALIALIVVTGLVGPALGLVLALVCFVPYVVLGAAGFRRRVRLRLPRRWTVWVARALAQEEQEIAVAIRPRQGDRRDAGVAVIAGIIVVVASVAMEQAAVSLGAQAGVSAIIVGGVVIAGVTSLPNAVAGVYLASRGRGAATLSTAFNSNAINVILGFLVPAAFLSLVQPSADGRFVAVAYAVLTAMTVVLALMGRGLDRRAGSIIIVAYLVFVGVLATR